MYKWIHIYFIITSWCSRADLTPSDCIDGQLKIYTHWLYQYVSIYRWRYYLLLFSIVVVYLFSSFAIVGQTSNVKLLLKSLRSNFRNFLTMLSDAIGYCIVQFRRRCIDIHLSKDLNQLILWISKSVTLKFIFICFKSLQLEYMIGMCVQWGNAHVESNSSYLS